MGLLLSTFAAFAGFGASIFFVIGSVRLDNAAIIELATPNYDHHSDIAKTHIEQKWLYTFGSVLLILAFIAQAIFLAPFSSNSVTVYKSAAAGFSIAGGTATVLWIAAYLWCKSQMKKWVRYVDQISDDQIKQQERELVESNAKRSH